MALDNDPKHNDGSLGQIVLLIIFSVIVVFSYLITIDQLHAKVVYLDDKKYIKFQMSIENKLEDLIRSDFSYLGKVSLKDLTARQKEIFEISEKLSELDVKERFKFWPYQRIHFFLKDTNSERLIDKIKVHAEKVVYPNALDLPVQEYSSNTDIDDLKNSNARTGVLNNNGTNLMANIGATLYFTGKLQKIIYSLKIRNSLLSSKDVIVNSPRVGLIQLGNLLDKKSGLINSNPDAEINSIFRLSILFHEGKHSDGHGTTLGFLHALCPKFHDYEGAFACDANTNGPYTVGAETAKILLKSCKSCSVKEKEQLNLFILDSLNRRISKSPGGEKDICKQSPYSQYDSCEWNGRPEYVVDPNAL